MIIEIMKTKLYRKYYPFTYENIATIEDIDKIKLIKMTEDTSREIMDRSFYLAYKCGYLPLKGMFSGQKVIDVLKGNTTEITSEDIDMLNFVLFRNKYIFPFSAFFRGRVL